MEVAHRAKIAHRYAARLVEAVEKLRLPQEEAGKRLTIGRVKIGNLARAIGCEAEARDQCLRALAQIDREADTEAEEQLQMGIAQMFDRGGEFASRQVLEAEVEIVVGHLDRDADRVQIAEIDGA